MMTESVLHRRMVTSVMIGNACWIFGVALMIGGHGEWAWMPISWGGFAFGYRYGLKAEP